MRMILKRQEGFTFIELMVSLSILLISVAGTFSLFSIGFRRLAVPKHLMEATNIAQKKIEEIKNTSFSLPEGDYAVSSLPGGSLNISYSSSEVDLLDVSVSVSWQEGNNERTIKLVTQVSSP